MVGDLGDYGEVSARSFPGSEKKRSGSNSGGDCLEGRLFTGEMLVSSSSAVTASLGTRRKKAFVGTMTDRAMACVGV